MRRFAVGTGGLTPAQETELQSYFTTYGTWWHWLPNFWLVLTSKDDTLTASKIRDRIVKFGAHCMVVEVQDKDHWAGYGPKTPPRDMFDWMHSSWEG